jgi:protein-L-isoaspartate(D-aspartate) O-methyltransferase
MTAMDTPRHQGMRKKLVDGLKIKGIRDEKVLKAMLSVPRHVFMDSSFIDFAYRDQAFPIGAGQTISQPYTVAFQTQLLDVQPYHKVLEIGTGSGYQAAILCALRAKVYTIERQMELYIKVQKLLPDLGYNPIFFLGDGYKGLPTYGPFDRILVTAGAPYVPDELIQQLAKGGKMVIPVGTTHQQEMLLITRLTKDDIKTEKHGLFVFVPLLKGTIS